MMKKIFLNACILSIVLVALLSTFSMAAYSDVTMEVVNEPVGRVYFTERSYFEKSLYHKDLANKEVTIQLKVVNDELPSVPNGEIVFLIDNSDSMDDQINGKTRLQIIKDSATSLAEKLLASNSDVKIAIASFSSVPSKQALTDEGTTKDANSVLALSSNLDEISSAIDSIPAKGSYDDSTDHPRTDLDAGLEVANGMFSKDTDVKYLVVLTDGVPNVALGYDKQYYGQDAIDKTIAKLTSLDEAGVNIITMLSKVEDSNGRPGYGSTSKTYGEIINEIFGTPDEPKTGVFYYVDDTAVGNTITNDIFNDLAPAYVTLTNIKITDYFPQEIIDNFDFAYVDDPTHGDISPSIDSESGSITWTIPELETGEQAIVQYKLKLKEGFDTAILDKVLDTNDGVDIEYTDPNGENQKKELTDTPQIKLTEPTPSPSPSPSPKPAAPKPTVLPKAGSKALIIVATAIAGISSIFFGIKYRNINN